MVKKWDGYRCFFILSSKGNRLLSRYGNNWIDKVPQFSRIIPSLDGTVLDGEAISKRENIEDTKSVFGGSPDYAVDFQKKHGRIKLVIFDCIKYKGKTITQLSLEERRRYLRKIYAVLKKYNFPVILEKTIKSNKENFYQNVVDAGGEGIVAKNISGKYYQGKRSAEWIKVKEVDTYDFIILGFTRGKGRNSQRVGAIIYGAYNNQGKLISLGKSSGMTDGERNDMAASPRKYIGKVAEFKAQELTKDLAMRFPRFIQLRLDKNPKEVLIEDLRGG